MRGLFGTWLLTRLVYRVSLLLIAASSTTTHLSVWEQRPRCSRTHRCCYKESKYVYHNLLWPPSVPESNFGIKYIVLGQIFYAVTICFIRAAICMSFLRVTESKFCRITVQCICFFSCANFVTGFVSAVSSCRPLSAAWNPGTGECFDVGVITDLGYFISALNIVTDVACAVVAYFIFKNSEMKTPVRVASFAVQVLGAMFVSP